jgi:hypothetical protein
MNLENFGMDDARMIVGKLADKSPIGDWVLEWPAGLGDVTIAADSREALALKLVNAIIAKRALYGGS